MNIHRFQDDHVFILSSIDTLRKLSRAGTADNAARIADTVVAMSGKIKLHLAAEDTTLYPAMIASPNARAGELAQHFQTEMQEIAQAYKGFASRWNRGDSVARNPDGFREDANRVLKLLYQRMMRENRELYPLAAAI